MQLAKEIGFIEISLFIGCWYEQNPGESR